jgi:CBS domain-containing protein
MVNAPLTRAGAGLPIAPFRTRSPSKNICNANGLTCMRRFRGTAMHGCRRRVGIVDHDGVLVGIITDADLRRHMSADLLSRTVETIMTREPVTVRPDRLVSEALELLNALKKTQLWSITAARSASCTSTTCCAPAWPDPPRHPCSPGDNHRAGANPIARRHD